MKNRYVDEGRLEFLLSEAERMFTYSPPDPARLKEHERIGEVLLEAVRTIIRTCPDSHETQMAIDYLWLARACANGALATYDPKDAFNESEANTL